MDVITQLLEEKTVVLGRIAEAAKRGDSQEVLARGDRLEKIESLIRRYENLVRDISSLDQGGSVPSAVSPLPEDQATQQGSERKSRDSTSGKGAGKTIRSAFLEGLSENGIRLRQVKGTIYETESRRRVGIAVATERKPDRWFLGLPLGGFDHAILLCERETGGILEFWLPKSFFDDYGNSMSHSGDQVKFNIARRGNGYVVLVPGTDGVSTSAFRKDYSLLK